MSNPRQPARRTRRIGVAVTAAALATAAAPAAHAQETPSGESSLTGLIPKEIVIGGPDLAAGSERMRDAGSGESVDAGLSAAQVVGSVTPLEAIGSAGGSAAASVASSGSLPGSTYVNPTGSIGSGVIGLGSVKIPETAIGLFGVQLIGGYLGAMGARQEAGTLTPAELDFWHGVVVGSADAGTRLEDAAAATGTRIPGSLAGSIDSVQRSALENPHEAQERIKAKADAEEAAGGGADGEATPTLADAATPTTAGPAGPAGRAGAEAGPARAAAGASAVASAPAGLTATAGPTLAYTGVDARVLAGAAVLSVLLGGLLLSAASRRRA